MYLGSDISGILLELSKVTMLKPYNKTIYRKQYIQVGDYDPLLDARTKAVVVRGKRARLACRVAPASIIAYL